MTVPKPTRKKRVPGDMNQAFAKPPSFKWSAPLEYCRQLGKAPHHIKVHSLAKRRSIDFVADVDHAIHQVNNAAELEMTEDDRFKLKVRALEIWHYCAPYPDSFKLALAHALPSGNWDVIITVAVQELNRQLGRTE